jgi:hypothetical protein
MFILPCGVASLMINPILDKEEAIAIPSFSTNNGWRRMERMKILSESFFKRHYYLVD